VHYQSRTAPGTKTHTCGHQNIAMLVTQTPTTTPPLSNRALALGARTSHVSLVLPPDTPTRRYYKACITIPWLSPTRTRYADPYRHRLYPGRRPGTTMNASCVRLLARRACPSAAVTTCCGSPAPPAKGPSLIMSSGVWQPRKTIRVSVPVI